MEKAENGRNDPNISLHATNLVVITIDMPHECQDTTRRMDSQFEGSVLLVCVSAQSLCSSDAA